MALLDWAIHGRQIRQLTLKGDPEQQTTWNLWWDLLDHMTPTATAAAYWVNRYAYVRLMDLFQITVKDRRVAVKCCAEDY